MKKITKFNQQGFTLLEVMVVTVLIGIFAAMGIPSLLASMEKQRIEVANYKLYNVLMNTQQKAQKENLGYTVGLKMNDDDSLPQYAVYPKDLTDTSLINWQNLTETINELEFVLDDGTKVVFDYQGKIDEDSEIQVNEQMIIKFKNNKAPLQRCLIVKSIFGYIYNASDSQCS